MRLLGKELQRRLGKGEMEEDSVYSSSCEIISVQVNHVGKIPHYSTEKA